MHSTVSVITPAKDTSLLTLYEARLALNLTTEDPVLDEKLEMLIRWSSAEIAAMCNRVFAQETVQEIFYDVDISSSRLVVSHYPIKNVISLDENGVIYSSGVDFVPNAKAGLLRRIGNTWAPPVEVIYTGGYDLPHEAPDALRHATMLLTREAYYSSIRGDASVRMVAHKDSRIIYFDPNAKSAQSASAVGGSAAMRAASDLLKKFTRFWV